jgi:hypothetical protein
MEFPFQMEISSFSVCIDRLLGINQTPPPRSVIFSLRHFISHVPAPLKDRAAFSIKELR